LISGITFSHVEFRVCRWVLIAGLCVGCDSLRARFIAQRAVDLYHRGKIAEAAAKFGEAEKLDPNLAVVQLNAGFANLSLYRSAPKSPEGEQAAQKAIAAFESYLRLKPRDERAKVFLIQTFVDTGRYEDAVSFFKPEVERPAPSSEALNTLGNIASKTGKFQEARSWFEKRISVQPDSTDGYLALGVLLWDHLHNHQEVMGEQRLALANAAIQYLDKATQLSPAAPNAYIYTNLCYREKSFGETDDDAKRRDIEEANRFYKLGLERQKSASPPAPRPPSEPHSTSQPPSPPSVPPR
jgi:tetratricopeptide (TPR) repeat protein